MKNMSRKYLLLSAVVMLLFPYLAVTFVQGSGGLVVCLFLFFGVDPFLSLMIGKASGENMRDRWYWPLVNAGFFLTGVWLNFEMGEPEFLVYTGIYLAIGCAAMVVWAAIKRRVK
jgi:hypothetical protein